MSVRNRSSYSGTGSGHVESGVQNNGGWIPRQSSPFRNFRCLMITLIMGVILLSCGSTFLHLRHRGTKRFSSQSEYDAMYAPSSSPSSHSSRLATQSTMVPAAVTMQPTVAVPQDVDVHLFVIWHGAISKRDKILRDITKRFVVLDVKYFDWTSEALTLPARDLILPSDDRKRVMRALTSHDEDDATLNVTALRHDYFLTNLWRLYAGKGGWRRKGMSLKVNQCGRGPFIAVVVVDEKPHYAVEKTAHGDDTVNHNMNEAKKQYRKWSGGGFRVHGTFNPQEAAHDITLLFHVHPNSYATRYRELRLGHRTASNGGQLIDTFLNVSWPPSVFDSSAAPYLGPNGTFGFNPGQSFEVPSVWKSCSALMEGILYPQTLASRASLETEGFYSWDAVSKFPGALLRPSACDSWRTREWALVVPEAAWWGTVALLNGDITRDETKEALLNQKQPEVVLVAVRSPAGVVEEHRVHVRALLS